LQVVVGIATTGKRVESLARTIESLKNQVDVIHVYDNSIESVDLTDNGKFRFLELYDEPIYYFSCDDDIVYPHNYIKETILSIEHHQCIVSYHGRILRALDVSYYQGHSAFSCLGHYPQTKRIDVAGTGVCGFRTDYFNPIDIWKADDKRMSDLVFSLEASNQGKKIMHQGHKGRWITYIEQPKGTTIWETEHQREHRQIEVANVIFTQNKKQWNLM